MESNDETEVGTSGRRKFIAGAAGAAAAATAGVLATSSPAGASVTSNDVDISGALKWIDFGSPALNAVSLGSGGFAKATFSPFGDMVAMTLRIVVGTTGSSLGSGPWCLDSSDSSFAGFQPVGIVNDVPGQVTSNWQGAGAIVNLSAPNQNQYAVGSTWQDFSIVIPSFSSPLLVWGLSDRINTGTGNVLVNYAGAVPFGAVFDPVTVLYSTMMYQVVI